MLLCRYMCYLSGPTSWLATSPAFWCSCMLVLLMYADAVQSDSCIQDTVILSLHMGFCILNPLGCTYEAAAADRCVSRGLCAYSMLSCSSMVAGLLHCVGDCHLSLGRSCVWGVLSGASPADMLTDSKRTR